MGVWYAITPEAGTNIVLDPSAESGAASTGATYGGVNSPCSVTQSTTLARFGTHSYKIISDGANQGMSASSAAAAGSAHYVSFYANGTFSGSLQVSMDSGSNYNAASVIGGASGCWVRYAATVASAQANGSTSTRIRSTGSDGTWYVDGIMAQAVNYPTTFIGGWIGGCRWSGLANQSTSTRDAQYRSGGKLIDIEATYGCTIFGWTGAGMPAIRNEFQELALQPGAQYNYTKIEPRTLSLYIMPAAGGSASITTLHTLRKNLVNLFSPDRYRNAQPVTLVYYGANSATGVWGRFRYDGGFDYDSDPNSVHKIAVRLIADDPFWYTDSQETATLGLQSTLASNNYAAARIDGVWQNLGTGTNGRIRAIAIDRDRNRTYMAGDFTTGNSVTLNYIGYWDNYTGTFIAMDAGVNNWVYALAVDSSGNVWVGGKFTTVGSGATACTGLARWNYSTSTWTAFNPAGITLGGGIFALSIAPDTGDVFIGGTFLNAGDASGDYITMYDVSASGFVSLSSGTGGIVRSILAVSSTEIYIGGEFTNLGDANGDYIVKWTGSAWVSLSTGTNGYVYALSRRNNGNIIAGGVFTSPASHIAEWNGTKWTALGLGVNDNVYCISINDAGLVIVGGFFTSAGGISLSNRVACWNNSQWIPLDITLPDSSTVSAAAWSNNGQMFAGGIDNSDLYLGYDATGTATISNTPTASTVAPSSTALTYPIITVTGPTTANALMTLQWIENYSQRCRIYLNMIISAGETVTFDFRPGKKRVTTSSMVVAAIGSNDRTKDVDSPSEFVKFALLPGSNTLNLYATGTVTGATAIANWQPVFISADGVAA